MLACHVTAQQLTLLAFYTHACSVCATRSDVVMPFVQDNLMIAVRYCPYHALALEWQLSIRQGVCICSSQVNFYALLRSNR